MSDAAVPIYGSVDKKTQRAAWTVGDKKNVTYEAGFANLTKNETTMLVHFGKDQPQQFILVRVEQSEAESTFLPNEEKDSGQHCLFCAACG